jgi:hypothetical protein
MGWLVGWSYRKSHVISAAAGAGTNYQTCIKVYKTTGTDGTETANGILMGKVYVGTNCRDDFGDIRFTDDDGDTLLDCWMETLSSGVYAVFWVEVKDTLESNATIYVYYSKSDATYPYLASDNAQGEATFLFFDHFDNADYTDKWTAGGTGGTITESGTVVTIKATGNWKDKYLTSKTAFALNTRAIFYGAMKNTENECTGIIGYGTTTLAESSGHEKYINAGYAYFFSTTSTGGAFTYTNNELVRNASYHHFKVSRVSSASVKYQIDSGTVVTVTTNIPAGSIPVILYGGSYGSPTAVQVECDYLFVTKYISPEPAHSTWGTEERSGKKGSGLVATVTEMLNSKMLFSFCNRFPKLTTRRF